MYMNNMKKDKPYSGLAKVAHFEHRAKVKASLVKKKRLQKVKEQDALLEMEDKQTED